MAMIRKLAAVAGATMVAGAFVAGPASADTPEVYAGSATAKALDVSILGQSATFGVSSAKIASDLTAKASGAGELAPAPLSGFAGASAASVTGSGTDTKPQACAASVALPAPVPSVLSLGLACSSSSASVVSGNPAAAATGSIASADLSANTILNGALAPVTGAVQDVLTTLLTQVNNITNSTPAGPTVSAATTTLQDLVGSLFKTQTLSATIGDSASNVTSGASAVTSQSTANASTIKLLPLPQLNGLPSTDPVATIQVGSASAKSVYDRVTGVSTPSFDPAIVTIKFNTVLTSALGLTEVKIGPNNVPAAVACTDDPSSACILQGTALESRIRVANGTTVKNADGSVGAVADGVRLDLLKGVNGGITLNLAHAEAGVGGVLSTKASPLLSPDLPRELPRTGGTPWIPAAGVGILALAVAVRRATAKASAN